MSVEYRLAAAILVATAALVLAFLAGASFAVSGHRCVSAVLPNGMLAVECADDLPRLGEF